MKNKLKLKIASLALCAASCTVLAVTTMNQTEQSASAATNTQVKEMYTLSGFQIEEKASIRRDDPTGIRFTTKVSASTKNQIIEKLGGDASKVVFGTLILPTDFLGGEELTHNTPSVVEGTVSEWLNDTTYTVVLGGKGGASLGETYYNRPISARSFAYNTETQEVCYTSNTASRSIGYVAYMAENDGDDSALVGTIADKTNVELVFNENISIYNDESDGLGLVTNKYEKQSDSVFALKVGGITVEDAVISYTSTDAGVIAVENGQVTAVGNGVATVAGSVTYNGQTYSFSKEMSTNHYVPSTQFTILLPENADKYEVDAADKLKAMILEATGVELAIVTESGEETTAGKYLSIGDTALAKANCNVSDLSKNTASRVKTVGETIFVRGATKAATLYGVQQLLGEVVGYEYYLNNTYVVSTTKEIVIDDKDYVPQIDEVWQIGGTADKVVSEEHGAIGYSSNLVPIGTTDEEDAQGTYRYKGAAHNSVLFFNDGVEDGSLYSLSSKSYKKWYATNSNNYYITNKNGLVSTFSGAGKVELCYTAHGDSTVRSQMIEKLAAEMFRKMTTIEEFKAYNRVAFSHNDIQSWCECSACNAEGNPSDNMLHFILDVAASLKTKLANAGDARANTFKICTLFYNETNLYAKNIANYQSAVDNYMQHVELWFAETRADYHVSLETSTTWNTTAKANFDKWTTLANSKGADVLWWGYYMSAKSSFIPYDSIDALRANYALAYNAGVDYMFNQSMQYTVNWVRLKQYLMSELRWNAVPDDATWNGWIADYMTAAFGPGAAAMTEYFNAWNAWADANAEKFENEVGYSGSGIYKLLSEVANTSNMSAETLKAWIASCNTALAALDANDAKYEIYYNNIVLERMTPLYLIMHLYGFSYSIASSNNPYNAITSYSLKNSAYVLPYAQDFLDAAEIWGVYQDGEMTNLDVFKTALAAQLNGITTYDETAKQAVVTGTSITLNSANIASGETYTATLINGNGEVSATTVTANNGSVTLTFASAPAVGACNVVLRSNSKAITFTNVTLVTGTIANYSQLKAITGKTSSGYYVLTNDITDASGTITLRSGTFSGVLDGNGYTVDGLSVGGTGLFRALSGATIKNINFTNFTASGPAFGTSATNSTFENVTISFKSGGPNLATTATNCTFSNVTVYVSSLGSAIVPEGVKVIVGADAGKTFYIPEGETEVWLRDSNLKKGTYTVDVDGDVYNTSVFAAGKIKVAIKGLALGETIKVSCDNGTAAYVYNVMRVAKLKDADGNLAPVYNGDKSALGYYESDVVQTLVGTVESGWGEAIFNDRVKIAAPGTQDYITVDFVAANNFNATMFQIWPTKGSGSLSKTGVFSDSDSPTGATVSIVDEYGFSVSSVSAGKRYTLRVYDPKAEDLAIGVYGINTIYFSNVTYGKGMPADPVAAPNVTVGDNRDYSIYNGDVTALGYENGTMVFTMWNATPDNLYGDGWSKRMIFGASTTQDYLTFEFVAKEDVVASNIFHVWGANGIPSIGTVSATTGKGGDWAIILDKNGLGVTSIKAGEHYFASIACAGLKEIQVGLIDANELYVANVTEHNGDLPTAIQPLLYAVDNSAVSAYNGDKTALGFAEDTLVFTSTAGSSTWNDNAIKFYTSSAANCLTIEFALDKALANNGNQFMIWTSKVSGAAAFINNGKVTQNSIAIEILDAEGNAVTSFEANTKYTFKIYHEGATTVTIALVGDTQAGATIYYGNYADTDDVYEDPNANLPENVVKYSTDGGHSGENVAKFKGDATAYGFADTDYVFEATMTNAWNDRVLIDVNSANYDYMDVEFVVTSGAWYFNAWVVNAGGMLDGNYLVAENGNGGYASHSPNTGANGGKTKIQVLDVNGNVVIGGRTNGTRYVLRVYLDDESLTQVQVGQANVTMLFANVTFGIVEETGPITQGDTGLAMPMYKGDVTAHGFAEGTLVQYMTTETMSNAWGTEPTSGKTREQLSARIPGEAGKYVTIQFATSEDIASGSLFYVWGLLNGAYTQNGGLNFTTTTYGRVMDLNGFPVTSITKNTVYVLELYIENTNMYKVSNLCLTGMEMYFAYNTITCSDKSFAVQLPGSDSLVQAGGSNKNAVTIYNGDETDLGFADGSTVYKYVGETSNDKISVKFGSVDYDYVDIQMVFDEASTKTWFLGFVMSGSSYLNGADAYILSGNNIRFNANANNPLDREIKFFDAEGNVVTTELKTGALYTLRIYIRPNNVTEIQMRQVGVTAYLANVTLGNDETVVKPDEVVLAGETKEELPMYAGNNADIGFTDTDYVFEQNTTSSSWSGRAHIGNNSEADFLVFDFSTSNPQNLTVWFTRNGNVIAGYSNIVTPTGYISANECPARIIYVFDEDNNAVTQMTANTRYTMWVYLGGADSFHGVAIGNGDSINLYYANVRYVYGAANNIFRQSDANALLPQYTGDVTALGYDDGTFVQTLVGTATTWDDGIYSNRARITATGAQDYVTFDFVLKNDLSGTTLFYLWGAKANGAIMKDGTSSAFTTSVVNEDGFAVASVEAGVRYTLRIYDPGATYYGIGAYCNTEIYLANIAYGKGELAEPYVLLNNATTFEGDVTALGFDDGEYVQQMVTEATTNTWDGTRQALAVDLPAPEGQYVSVMFSLDKEFKSSDGNLFFVWCRLGDAWPTNFYVTLTPSANARILGTNGEVVTDTLKANTVYMLELYADGVDKYQVANINKMALTVSFATKSVKTYETSIAASPVTGSFNNTVTVAYGNGTLGFGRNEVVKQLETETVGSVWGDTQPTSGKGRGSWLIKVAAEAGKVVKVRFALSKDFSSTGMLFYVWAYSDNSGTCPANGSVKLSGSSALQASITDEAGNAVTSLKAGQVYELSLYCDTAIKYDIGNFVAEGMITYVSSQVTLVDVNA